MGRRSHQPPRRTAGIAALAALALAWAFAPVLVPAPAMATSYQGFGDTGWTQLDRMQCCEAAKDLAAQSSIRNCAVAGGEPRVFPPENSRGTRGECEWEGRGDAEGRLYRCTATTDVHCR